MQLTGKIENVSIDYVSNIPKITLAINEKNNLLQGYEELKDCEKLSIEIKKYRKKRSLNSNNYCWLLIDKLAEKLNIPKTDIYKSYIREIGGVSYTMTLKNAAVSDLCKFWSSRGIGWVTDILSEENGYTDVILYCGSSVYDTAQMSRLIDMIVEDCKLQGIETLTPEELNKMKSLWGGQCE